jgi:hypothetical protein
MRSSHRPGNLRAPEGGRGRKSNTGTATRERCQDAGWAGAKGRERGFLRAGGRPAWRLCACTRRWPTRARTAPHRPPPLPPSCGVELPAQLVWSRWEPGGEYAKAITVTNRSKKVRGRPARRHMAVGLHGAHAAAMRAERAAHVEPTRGRRCCCTFPPGRDRRAPAQRQQGLLPRLPDAGAPQPRHERVAARSVPPAGGAALRRRRGGHRRRRHGARAIVRAARGRPPAGAGRRGLRPRPGALPRGAAAAARQRRRCAARLRVARRGAVRGGACGGAARAGRDRRVQRGV